MTSDSDWTEGAYVLPSGTRRRGVHQLIRDAFLDFTDGRWLEVTNTDPTPAGLQAYASSLPAGGPDADNGSSSDHCAFYRVDDILEGDSLRIIRLGVSATNILSSHLNIFYGDISTIDSLYGSTNSNDAVFFITNAYNATNTAGSLSNDVLLHFIEGDEFLCIWAGTAAGSTLGCVYIGLPSATYENRLAREDVGFIYGLRQESSSLDVLPPPYSGGGLHGLQLLNAVNTSSGVLSDDSFILSRAVPFVSGSNNAGRLISHVPRLRLGTPGRFGIRTYRTVEGELLFCIYSTPYDFIIDLTPEVE